MIRSCLILLLLIFISCTDDRVIAPEVFSCNPDVASGNAAHPQNQYYQSLLDSIISRGVPGIMMSVDNGEGTWSGASGKADLASQVDLQPCNITRVGSTVKTFTAVTILLLQEENKLDLDDRITKYLSPEQIKGLENANLATVRQLLQHSSGIYNYIVNPKFQTASLNDLTKVWTRDELLAYARNMDANFEPGSDVQYSNTNYILLGDIITKIEQKPFYKVFEEKIFKPLQLDFTRFAAEDPIPCGLISGYVDFYSNYNLINSTKYSGWDYFTADGGLISNPHDLTLFMHALFNGELISSASLEEMTDWRKPSTQDPEGYTTYYGLGIFKLDTEFGAVYMHSGDAIGYYATMLYFPEQRTALSWAVNGNYGAIDEHTQSRRVMDKIFRVVVN